MEKLIIKNHSRDYEMSVAMDLVQVVMAKGKISKSKGVDKYCHCTTFKDSTSVYCELLDSGTAVFTVSDF